MLHLVFSKKGLLEIKPLIKRRDQIVHICSEFIMLYNTDKLLRSIKAEKESPSVDNQYASAIEQGTIIDHAMLASIVSNAPSIKSTY